MHMQLSTEPPLLVGLRYANIDRCFWLGGALLFLSALDLWRGREEGIVWVVLRLLVVILLPWSLPY
jgi:hypothetical protein